MQPKDPVANAVIINFFSIMSLNCSSLCNYAFLPQLLELVRLLIIIVFMQTIFIINGKITIINRLIGLVHLVDWKLKEKSFELSNGFRICKYRNSPFERLFRNLIKENQIDEEDDTYYGFFIEIDNPFGYVFSPPYVSAFEYADVISSLISICSCGYIDLVYTFSVDEKRTKILNVLAHTSAFRLQSTWLLEKRNFEFSIDKKLKDFLKKSWGKISPITGKTNRLFQAIRLYGLACISYSQCESILFLVIIWEILFSPHSQSKISHQVSMSISKFLTNKKNDRKIKYEICKKIYGIRSKIIHGKYELKDINELNEAIDITSGILFKILSSSKISNNFLNENKGKSFYIILILTERLNIIKYVGLGS